MNKNDLVNLLLKEKVSPKKEISTAFTSTNIALCKYWGKRNEELNLPVTSSLSISMGEMGTFTELSTTQKVDIVYLNGKKVQKDSSFHIRTTKFLDLFRDHGDRHYCIRTFNTISTATGLASSASGFASLLLALRSLYGWKLSTKDLSILARLGSGSACRSLFQGFVFWNKGEQDTGLDSYAEPLKEKWENLRVGVLEVSSEAKSISSREAMRRTALSSPLYKSWPGKVEEDLNTIMKSIKKRDFKTFGQALESNSLTMHATMISAWPPIVYWQANTIDCLKQIWHLRENGLEVYLTMDAGPNIKILFLKEKENLVKENLPSIRIISPFENFEKPTLETWK